MDQYRVFGNPIKHSRSPAIHKQFAEMTNQSLEYKAELVGLDDFNTVIAQFMKQKGLGANITVPFKEQALLLSDHLTDRAKLAGAVNTLTFRDGVIYGDNTDGLGLVQDLLRNRVTILKSKILLVGAGGAAKGVILPLLTHQPNSIVIVNRTVSKAEELCHQFSDHSEGKLSSRSFDSLGDEPFDIIINATSASLSGRIPDLPSSVVNNHTSVYDMVYDKDLTLFLCWAQELGANQVIDGLGMLVGQAAESFTIWRNVKPDVETVLTTIRKTF